MTNTPRHPDYCQHNVYVGNPYTWDAMCGQCESMPLCKACENSDDLNNMGYCHDCAAEAWLHANGYGECGPDCKCGQPEYDEFFA
jgi:hypothetical protein